MVRYVKSCMVPEEGFVSQEVANQEAERWCEEVNADVHEVTKAVLTEQLDQEYRFAGAW